MIHVLPSAVKSQNGPRRGEVNPDSFLEVILELNLRRNAFRLRGRGLPQKRKGKERENMRRAQKGVCSSLRCVLKIKSLYQQLAGNL